MFDKHHQVSPSQAIVARNLACNPHARYPFEELFYSIARTHLHNRNYIYVWVNDNNLLGGTDQELRGSS